MDPLASHSEKIDQGDVDMIIAAHRARENAEPEEAKSISIRFGDVLRLQVKLKHVVTGATIASLLGGGWGYWHVTTPVPSSEIKLELPMPWTDRLIVVEQNQHALKEAMVEQRQDIREMRDDIRAIRSIMEKK